MTDLQYPTGKLSYDDNLTAGKRAALIVRIAAAPAAMRAAVSGLNDAQLDTAYRPGGWSVRQVVHHVPDSHLNAYVRFKLALTENEPTIKPYEESLWALLPDVQAVPIETSLVLLDAVHERWVAILRGMKPVSYTHLRAHETGR